MREITQQGITALKSGDRAAAFKLLATAVRQDPNDVQAWMWLSGAVDSDAARIDCLRQVLRIEPGNAAAAQGLARLLGAKPAPVTPARVETPPTAGAVRDMADRPPTPRQEPDTPKAMEESQAGASPVEPPIPAATEDTADRPPMPLPTPEASAAAGDLVRAQPEIEPENAVYEQPADAQPVEDIAALAPGTPFYRPMARPEVTYANYDQRVVFRTRPSQVPALICFWIFFFGAYFIGTSFTDQDLMFGMSLGFGVGIILELVIIYIVIMNFRTHYTLTNQELRLHTIRTEVGLPAGRDVIIPLTDIYTAECRQNFLQQLMGIGDLHLDATIEGQLGHTYLRGIPQCDQRAQQIMYLVREQQPLNAVFHREVS